MAFFCSIWTLGFKNNVCVVKELFSSLGLYEKNQ